MLRELDAEIDKAGLKGIVSRVGHCTDMQAAFSPPPSSPCPRPSPEAFGRVAVEAQAMGAPVVVSDLGAVPETVLSPPQSSPEGRTGWRVPAGDAAALADALHRRSASAPRRVKRWRAARARMSRAASRSTA